MAAQNTAVESKGNKIHVHDCCLMVQLTVKYPYVIIKLLTVLKSCINLPVFGTKTCQENQLAVFGRQEMSGEQLTVFGRKEKSDEPTGCVWKTRCHENQLAVFGRQIIIFYHVLQIV